jgi:hypothetical protein
LTISLLANAIFIVNFNKGNIIMSNQTAIDSFKTQLENPTLINIADAERALTQFVATTLNLTVDEDIFRGALPVGRDGYEIAVIKEVLENEPSKTVFYVELCGIHKNRDYVMQHISDFAKHLPLYGIEVNSIKFAAILKDELDFITFADNGKIKTKAMLSFEAHIK